MTATASKDDGLTGLRDGFQPNVTYVSHATNVSHALATVAAF